MQWIDYQVVPRFCGLDDCDRIRYYPERPWCNYHHMTLKVIINGNKYCVYYAIANPPLRGRFKSRYYRQANGSSPLPI